MPASTRSRDHCSLALVVGEEAAVVMERAAAVDLIAPQPVCCGLEADGRNQSAQNSSIHHPFESRIELQRQIAINIPAEAKRITSQSFLYIYIRFSQTLRLPSEKDRRNSINIGYTTTSEKIPT